MYPLETIFGLIYLQKKTFHIFTSVSIYASSFFSFLCKGYKGWSLKQIRSDKRKACNGERIITIIYCYIHHPPLAVLKKEVCDVK